MAPDDRCRPKPVSRPDRGSLDGQRGKGKARAARLSVARRCHIGGAALRLGRANSLSTGNRVRDQTYTYNLRGDVELSTDDANVFWDRSLGNVSSVGDQLASAGTTTGYGTLSTAFDAAGNLETVAIQNGSTYNYAFDELGRLASATRADPGGVQVLEQYAYDANGQRVRSTAENSATGATTHTVQVFDSLVLRNAAFPDASGNYEHDTSTEQLYLNANGQSFGRAFIAQGPMPLGVYGTVHVFMPMRDPLGSTSFVIDHDTGELVEAATYQAYGAVDSDFRPSRWDSPREDVRFTNHWDDAEVGLVYFGARYYSPNLMRFITPDPLSIHAGKGDLNPYEYANGSPMRFVDPLGLAGCDPNDDSMTCAAQTSTPNPNSSVAPLFSPTSYDESVDQNRSGQSQGTASDADAGLSETPQSKQYDQQYGTIAPCDGCIVYHASSVQDTFLAAAPFVVPGGPEAKVAEDGLDLAAQGASVVLHHVFPQQFEGEFEQIFKGTGETIHDYTIPLPQSLHQTIHSNGWNADWEEFLFSNDALPSATDTKAFATQQIFDYGLEDYLPFVPYGE
jgi:RHS repeat-associated protein